MNENYEIKNYNIDSYRIKVNINGEGTKEFIDEDGYEEWGTWYDTEEEAIANYEDYMNVICDKNSDKYKTYTSRPIKVVHVEREIHEIKTTTEEFKEVNYD